MARSASLSGGGASVVVRLDSARVARARWSALLTDATEVSSSSATSEASQRRTSRRMSTARWRAGSCCRAATKARRMDSFSTASSAGSRSGAISVSGMGSIHILSERAFRFFSNGSTAGPRSMARSLPCASNRRHSNMHWRFSPRGQLLSGKIARPLGVSGEWPE